MEGSSSGKASHHVPWGAQEMGLLARAREDGDDRAMDELFHRMMPLARRLARRFQRSDEPLDDLLQVANLALIRALQRFDPARGVTFQSFAVRTIVGELKRYRRDVRYLADDPGASTSGGSCNSGP
jgi:RNA polymerase sigma-B factor